MNEAMTGQDPDTTEAMLTQVQARILGSLMEKQMTTPDYYPLTLNALVAACNQKSSRTPVMNLEQGEVLRTVGDLRREGLITANMHGRTDRYEQHLSRKLGLNSKERAVVCVLLLRGPQTLNEIRTHTSRMTEFADHDEIQLLLNELMGREDAVVMQLPRAAGQREERYTHLLCGTPTTDTQMMQQRSTASPSSHEARIEALEQAVSELREEIRQLRERHEP